MPPPTPVIRLNGVVVANGAELDAALGEELTVDLLSTTGYTSFAWRFGKPVGSSSGTGFSTTLTPEDPGLYRIAGVATGPAGTSSARLTVSIVRTPNRGLRLAETNGVETPEQAIRELKTRFNEAALITDTITGVGLTLTDGATSAARQIVKPSGGTGASELRVVASLAQVIDELEHTERVINPLATAYGLSTAGTAASNTSALNSALADAKSTGRPVVVPPGSYAINPISLRNAYGVRFLGSGRGVTTFNFAATAGNYYDAQAALGFSITQGTTALTMPAGFLDQGVADAGKRLFVQGAGASGERLDCAVVSVSGTTVTISTPALTTVSNVVGRIVPPAAIELLGMEQCLVGNFTIAGPGSSGAYQMWAGLRVGSAPLGGTQVSQRNCFTNLHIGSTQVGIEVYGPRDGNNDLSSIVQPYIANYDLAGIAIMDSQCFDWKVHGPTCYGDGGWETAKVCSIGSGSTTLTTPVARFGRRHRYQWIEIEGAGPGGTALFTQILSVTSSTQVTVANAASVAVTATAALRMGAQTGLLLGGLDGLLVGGNCAASDLLFTSHLLADVYDAGFNGGAVEISGGSSEASRALYAQPINGGTIRKTTIRGYRFAQGAVRTERPVLAVTAGPFAAERVDFGQAGSTPAALRIQIEPQTPAQFVAAFRDCNISTSLPREDVFSKVSPASGALRSYKPTSADNVVLHGTGGVTERIDRYQRNEDGRPESWLRVEGTRQQGPDFSGLGTLLLDYDPMAHGSLERVVGTGGSSTYRGRDRSGNGHHATRTGSTVASTCPSLQAAGKYGRLGWRFHGGSALFMPSAAFSALTAIEVWAVVQIMTPGGGFHAVGTSGSAGDSCHTPYTDNVVYEDALGVRSSSSALPTLANDVRLFQIRSDASQHVVSLDGTAIITAGAHAVVNPANPVLGAGGANGTTPSAIFDGVVLRYVVFSAVANAQQRAAGLLACQEFYGTP